MKNKFIAYFIYCILKILNATLRYRVINQQVIDKIDAENSSYIVAIWHQNLIHSTLSHASVPHATMASNSKDGDIITAVLHHLGYVVARGSSRKGGREAILQLIQFVRQGYPAAVTVDGPLGPAHEPKHGVFSIAKACKVPVVPSVAYPERYWSINNWDHFRIPKPFSRVCIYFNEPIFVAQHADTELFKKLAQKVKLDLEQGEQTAIRYLQDNPG